MKWSKDFYDKQFKWLHANKDYNTEGLLYSLVDKLEQCNVYPPTKILELGGGSGQFAVAAAKRGYDVTVIDIAPSAVTHINALAEKNNIGSNLRVIQGDFYEALLPEQFDAICYWDGFGIGTDEDQQILLKRILNWLKPNGIALIDIYTPWYWAKVTGQQMIFGDYVSNYDFDAIGCRMLNTCWVNSEEETKIQQSLRCYSPADLNLLIKNTKLKLLHCEPGGEMDYENKRYHPDVPLERAMTFLAKIKKEK